MFAHVRHVFIGLLFLIFSSSSSPAQQPQSSAATAEFLKLEQIWNDAYIHNDVSALDKLLADDLVVTMTNMALLDKTQSIALLRSGHLKFPRYETSDIRVRVYDDAAVV